jgi:hypothetical protein
MNCCDQTTTGDGCHQGRHCPVRRQPSHPATLAPDLPVWPERAARPTRRRRRSGLRALLLTAALSAGAAALHHWLGGLAP